MPSIRYKKDLSRRRAFETAELRLEALYKKLDRQIIRIEGKAFELTGKELDYNDCIKIILNSNDQKAIRMLEDNRLIEISIDKYERYIDGSLYELEQMGAKLLDRHNIKEE